MIHSRIRALGLLTTAVLFTLAGPTTHGLAQQGASGPAQLCDALAAGPVAGFSPTPAVPFEKLRAQASAAIKACQDAASAQPTEPRFAYQLGRSMLSANHRDTAALSWLRKAADLGYAPALNAVGVAYNKGFGVELNDSKATAYFQRAVDKNYPPAFANLASFNAELNGNFYSYAAAYALQKKGAELGDPVAMTQLGSSYWGAYGVPEDLAAAKMWYDRAHAAGDVEALARLADHHGGGGQYQRYIDEAVRLGHRHILLQQHIYSSGARSRAAILKAVNMESWDIRREGGLLYSRFSTGDHDHGLFWSIMFSRRASHIKWTAKDYDDFLAPIKRRHNCMDGRLYLVRNGLLGCSRD